MLKTGDRTIIASDRRARRAPGWWPIALPLILVVQPIPPPPPPPVAMASLAVAPPPAPVVVPPPVPVEAPSHLARRPHPTGLLTVECNVPARALLDGSPIGTTPVPRFTTSPGEHKLRVENAALGLSRSATVVLKEGRETVERIEFKKGRLNVQVDPWADVWLDDKKLGQTPLAAREAWEGKHALRLVGDRGEKRLDVEVTAGQTAVVRETLPH